MKPIDRRKRFTEASTEIRTVMLLASDMLVAVERARNSYTKRQAELVTEAMNLSTDITSLHKRIQTVLRPMSKYKTPAERRKAAKRASRRRER